MAVSSSDNSAPVRGLFNRAGGVIKDIATFPFRVAASYASANGPQGETDIVLPVLTPTIATMVGGGILFVGGAKNWPLAVSSALAFQYGMDLLMKGDHGQKVFPSLHREETNAPKEVTTFVSHGEAAADASPEILSRVTFVPKQP